jgi:thiamine pyrophosphate-dependent acetolactate synthase large subunit-like protein
VRRVVEASRIDDYVDMAFTAAASGRPGPAVLLVPQEALRLVGDAKLTLMALTDALERGPCDARERTFRSRAGD